LISDSNIPYFIVSTQRRKKYQQQQADQVLWIYLMPSVIYPGGKEKEIVHEVSLQQTKGIMSHTERTKGKPASGGNR
jgi:hypothetical protein